MIICLRKEKAIWSHLSLCSCWPALFTAPKTGTLCSCRSCSPSPPEHPATHPLVKGCNLPGLHPTHHALMKTLMSIIQLTSPEKPLQCKWEVTRSWARRTQNCYCTWGWAVCVQGVTGRERKSGELRLLESSSHPATGKTNWRQNHEFYWVILSSSALPAPDRASPCWRQGDAHGPHQQICAQNSCRSGLLLPVETRTRLNVESYKFLQQHASLQHVARNVAVAMVKNSCLVKSVKSCIIS